MKAKKKYLLKTKKEKSQPEADLLRWLNAHTPDRTRDLLIAVRIELRVRRSTTEPCGLLD